MLTFDADTHTYRWKGRVVLSVTQIIETAFRMYAGISDEVLQAAQLRGTMVHLMCQFHDEDALDESQFTETELAYLPAWKRFVRECRPNWTAMEQMFYDETFGYPGTADREGSLESPAVEDAIFDIKTAASSSPLWGLQTAAYARGKKRRRFTVQLRPDGTYKLIEWTDRDDWSAFLSLINLNRFVTKHNL